jgi:aspartate kinase
LIVQKFGGSCLDGPEDLRRMVSIVGSAGPLGLKVVLSAFRGVTDELLSLAAKATDSKVDITKISAKHLGLLAEIPKKARRVSDVSTRRLLAKLDEKLAQVSRLGLLTPWAQDDIAAYGERLAASVAEGYFAEADLESVPLSGADAGIITDGVFGDASIMEGSAAEVRRRLTSVRLPLVASFFGTDAEGRTTTLGRGASDYVATFIASALGCKAVLFKDVDGVMTADPRVVPGPGSSRGLPTGRRRS